MQVERSGETTLSILLGTEAETDRLGQALAEVVEPGVVIGLVGTLGAGKTRLVRAVAEALGVSPEAIASPTFVLIHEYEGRLPIYHFDAYRLNGPDDFDALGASDYWSEGEGLCLIEWADLVEDRLPREAWWIRIELDGPTGRLVRLESPEALRVAAILEGSARDGCGVEERQRVRHGTRQVQLSMLFACPVLRLDGVGHGPVEVEQRHRPADLPRSTCALDVEDLDHGVREGSMAVSEREAGAVVGGDEDQDVRLRLEITNPILDVVLPGRVLDVVDGVDQEDNPTAGLRQVAESVGQIGRGDRRGFRETEVGLRGGEKRAASENRGSATRSRRPRRRRDPGSRRGRPSSTRRRPS